MRTPADLKGQKVRMMGNLLFVDTMNAMGRQWHLDGIWRGVHRTANRCGGWRRKQRAQLLTSNHYNTGAKYYTQTNHLIIPELLVVSKATWDKLSKDDQALLKKFGREAQMRTKTPQGQERCREHGQAQVCQGGVHYRGQQTLLCEATALCAPSTAPTMRS